MIAIINIGGGDANDIMGWREYEVRINRDIICKFMHRRSDGLSVCLQKAANAVETKKWQQFESMTTNIKQQ
jgi:hypothetical protein